MQRHNKLHLHYLAIDKDNRIVHTVFKDNNDNSGIPEFTPSGYKCYEMSEEEALYISYLMIKPVKKGNGQGSHYFDPVTRIVTNDKGEQMFSPETGNAYTHSKDDNVKYFVEELSEADAKLYRDTLKKVKELDLEYKELEKNLSDKYNEIQNAIEKHVSGITLLHEKLCKILAISGYNEFKHKIHVDKDGKVYMVPKNAVINLEDL